jgi:hypothetical protein
VGVGDGDGVGVALAVALAVGVGTGVGLPWHDTTYVAMAKNAVASLNKATSPKPRVHFFLKSHRMHEKARMIRAFDQPLRTAISGRTSHPLARFSWLEASPEAVATRRE